MLKRIHPIAGILGLVIILTFWLSTVGCELFGTRDTVVALKTTLPWGLILLIPALATAGASGFKLGGQSRSPLVTAKKRRMPIIAINGICVLTPCVLFLAHLAARREFGLTFDAVQAVELTAGALNIVLLQRSMFDGLRLKNRFPATSLRAK